MVRHSWRTQLKSANNENDVLAIVERYLREWSTDEIASLPSGAWPDALRSRRELLAHGMKLAELHSEYETSSSALARLQELLLFFTHAGVRITQLAAVERQDDCPGHRKRAAKKRSPAMARAGAAGLAARVNRRPRRAARSR